MLTTGAASGAQPGPRERILETAYELFSERGIQSVSVDEIVERSGVAKATLYRQFSSKDALVLAFLERRERRWTLDWLAAETQRRGSSAEERLLSIFDVFGEWFRRADFEGCSFVNGLLEMGSSHPVGKACAEHLENIRALVDQRARQAGLRATDSFAYSWHILMKGSIVAAAEGDQNAAQRAKSMARHLIDEHR